MNRSHRSRGVGHRGEDLPGALSAVTPPRTEPVTQSYGASESVLGGERSDRSIRDASIDRPFKVLG